MTDTAEQKRPTLTLNRKPKGIYQKPQQDAPRDDKTTTAHTTAHKVAGCGKSPQQSTGRNRKNIKARARKMAKLIEYWPDLFSQDNPKPLKVGVLDDLQRDIAARGLEFGRGSLKAALTTYTKRPQYQQALATGGQRYNLTGQPAGSVTAEQQQNAAAVVKKAKARTRDNDK